MDSSHTSGPTSDGSNPQSRGVSGEMPTRDQSGHVARDAHRSKPGDRVGPYTLMELIGEGGFGTVWLAERREPMVQRVAIKIIKPGMDSKAVVARFEQERQALAVMDHPNVAKVFDGGVTERGLPYFVMEHVAGEPITNFCDRHRYTIRQRLELFTSVCDAVQHAHMKGIIHRDLKPSNVLAEMVDGKPLVKVIDFGIAKAMDTSEVQNSVFSMEGQLIGTPEYMSPEQAGGRTDIDTRTDVYSLGVMLYELLVGRLPFDPATLRQRGMDEIRRIIREDEPPKPSTRLSTIGAEGSTIALSRHHHSPATLIRELRRELEWIPLKAMRKERDRRYDSAAAFGDDVRRYLDGRALRAAPESRVYLAKKFVGRNRAFVGATLAVIAALAVGLGATLWQAREAATQRDAALLAESKEAEQRLRADERAAAAIKAEAEARTAQAAEKTRADELKQVSDFQSSMLSQIDTTQAGIDLMADVRERYVAALEQSGVPEEVRPKRQDAFRQDLVRVNATDIAAAMIDRTILKPAAKAIDERFRDQPVVDASLRQALAGVYLAIGLYDAAYPLQESALLARRRTLGAEHPDTLDSLNNLGYVLLTQGKLAEAEPYFRDSIEMFRRVRGEDHPETINVIVNMGNALQAQGRLADAEPYLREALEKRRRVLGDEHSETLASLISMSGHLHLQGKFSEAEPLCREALDTCRRVLGADNPITLSAMNNMGFHLDAQGKLHEAEPYYREALERRRRVLGEDHPVTLESINNMGFVLQAQGKYAEAEPYYREAVEKGRRVLGEEHPSTCSILNNFGVLLQEQEKLAEAELYYREALAKRRRVLGESHPSTLNSLNSIGVLLQDQGKLVEAETLLREAVDKCTRELGREHPTTLMFITNMGKLLEQEEKHEEVIALLLPVEAAASEAFTQSNVSRLADLLTALGRARVGLGFDSERFGLGEQNLQAAFPLFAQTRGRTHKDTLACAQALVDLYTAWDKAEPGRGHDAKAAAWKAKLPAAPPDAPKTEATPR